tara:strand:+ start:177 stop:296 length:120 start_codon:yes stop_codon:yes gene_type:complete
LRNVSKSDPTVLDAELVLVDFELVELEDVVVAGAIVLVI